MISRRRPGGRGPGSGRRRTSGPRHAGPVRPEPGPQLGLCTWRRPPDVRHAPCRPVGLPAAMISRRRPGGRGPGSGRRRTSGPRHAGPVRPEPGPQLGLCTWRRPPDVRHAPCRPVGLPAAMISRRRPGGRGPGSGRRRTSGPRHAGPVRPEPGPQLGLCTWRRPPDVRHAPCRPVGLPAAMISRRRPGGRGPGSGRRRTSGPRHAGPVRPEPGPQLGLCTWRRPPDVRHAPCRPGAAAARPVISRHDHARLPRGRGPGSGRPPDVRPARRPARAMPARCGRRPPRDLAP